MTTATVVGGGALRGTVRVPGDKSISHRVLILSALAEGASTVSGLSDGLDVRHTLAAIECLGAEVEELDDVGRLRIDGGSLREPESVLDVGNSGTGLRLLTGVCAAQPFLSVLQGDASIARRPMDRVVEPLRLMGARIDGRDAGRFPPVVVRGGRLSGIDYELPVASAQVKGAILLAGLAADGETIVRERSATRAHTEELLAQAGAAVEVRGSAVHVRRSALAPCDWRVPGDPSQAAFWVVGACVTPGSDVTVDDVYLGPCRDTFLAVLARMGAEIDVDPSAGVIRARTSGLVGVEVTPAEAPGLIDEIPILAVAAAAAEGDTVFRGAAELRVKESDRIATVCALIEALGGAATPTADGLVVHGGRPLTGGLVESHGDHRIAMAAAIAGVAAAGSTAIDDTTCVATSYPTFFEHLGLLGAAVEVVA